MKLLTNGRPLAPGLRRRLVVFLILAGILVAVSLFAPLLCPNDPNATSSEAMNQPPSREFPFGTDRYGRCICSRVLMGARTSIFSAVALVAITFLVGSLLGMAAGWFGGVVDTVVMRLADTAAPVRSYLFATANDHQERDPSDWTLEASADGTSWTTVDTRTGVSASSTRDSYSAYNDGVPYKLSSYEPLNGAVLALGTTVKVDPGASLSFAAAPPPVSSLAVDGGGAGSIDTLTIAPNGALHLTGVPRVALSGYSVPLTIGQISQRENLRSWTVYLDGVAQGNAKILVQGSTLYIGQGGTMVIFR